MRSYRNAANVKGPRQVPVRTVILYKTQDLSIEMGQSYGIIVQAENATSENFWLRTYSQDSRSETDALENIKFIIRGNSTGEPTSSTCAYPDPYEDEL